MNRRIGIIGGSIMRYLVSTFLCVSAASTAYAQSDKLLEKPTPTKKVATSRHKTPATPNMGGSEPIRNIYQGDFDFKGFSLGKPKEEVFSDPTRGRNILGMPGPGQIKGFLSIGVPKNVKSEQFGDFVCSKELGSTISKKYELNLKRRFQDGEEHFQSQLEEGRAFQRRYGYTPDRTSMESTLLELKKIAEEDEKWRDSLKNSDTKFAECVDTIANRRVESLHLSFYKDRLGAITVFFEANGFNSVLEGLTEKFGPPYESGTQQLSVKFTGAPSSFIFVAWKDSKGSYLSVQNHEQDGSAYREKGILKIIDPQYEAFLSEEKKSNGVVPASRDL